MFGAVAAITLKKGNGGVRRTTGLWLDDARAALIFAFGIEYERERSKAQGQTVAPLYEPLRRCRGRVKMTHPALQ
jgi:hypothetical protein